MKIAIDGPAGSGKSTLAHALAERCQMTYLDTGAMYRAVTWGCLQAGCNLTDEAAVTRMAEDSTIHFERTAVGQKVFFNGVDVTQEIRTPEVDAHVSIVAAVPGVRHALLELQRKMAGDQDVVAEGRDIGTAVFPDAEVKIFLTADPQARAHRRAVQRAGGDAASGKLADVDPKEVEVILQNLKERDKIDSSRETTPLKQAADAHLMDSSTMSVEEEISQIVSLIDAARATVVRATPAEATPKAEAAPAKAAAHATASTSTPDALARYYDNPMRDYPVGSRAFIAFAVGVVGAVTKILWPWRIEDADELWVKNKDEKGRMIVMNHVSMLDPVVVYVSQWVHGHRVRCIYKSEFDTTRAATWLFSRAGAFPVKRGTADLKAVRRAQRALERGEDVLVFPEGTRIKSDNEPVEIHGGFALIAQLAHADVLPIAIVGAQDITTRTRKFPHFHRVYLKVGESLRFDALGVSGRKKQVAEMERVAMERVYQLRHDLRQEHPGKR
jgi:pantoate ligase/cytidylate kinase